MFKQTVRLTNKRIGRYIYDVIFIWRNFHVNAALMRLTKSEPEAKLRRNQRGESAYIGAHCCHFSPYMISPHPPQTHDQIDHETPACTSPTLFEYKKNLSYKDWDLVVFS